MTEFFETSWVTLVKAASGLILPGLFFLILAILVKGRRWITDIKRALPETGLNVQIFMFNIIISIPLTVIAVTWFHGFLDNNGLIVVPAEFWASMPSWLVIFCAVFIGDFVAYWRHRIEHSPLLWPAHAVHHSDTEMTWLSLERFHPINIFTTFVIDGTALLVLGLPPFALVANNIVRHYYGYVIHADLPWTMAGSEKSLSARQCTAGITPLTCAPLIRTMRLCFQSLTASLELIWFPDHAMFHWARRTTCSQT